ncbi:MAG: peptide-N-glycosidase F-related protein [Parabacteroides merdae]
MAGETPGFLYRERKDIRRRKWKNLSGSSDLSRSNWCPGSDVMPEEILLTDIAPGKHTFTVSIPEAAEIDGNKLNHWLVSAYLVWEK